MTQDGAATHSPGMNQTPTKGEGFKKWWAAFLDDPGHALYPVGEWFAKLVKVLGQMVVGGLVMYTLYQRGMYVWHHPTCRLPDATLEELRQQAQLAVQRHDVAGAQALIGKTVETYETAKTPFCYRVPDAPDVLNMIADGLAVAAVIELAYTLFTPGPDEAVEPLMLGVSAAALFQLAKVDRFSWQEAIAALLYVLVLAALFAIRGFLATGYKHTDRPWWASLLFKSQTPQHPDA